MRRLLHRVRAALAPLVPLALLALAACDDLAPDRSQVVVRYQELAPLGRERLAVLLDDPERQYYLEGLDLEPDDGWLASRTLGTARSGELVVRLAVRGASAAPAVVIAARVPLRPRSSWRLDIFPSSLPAAQACAGCTGLTRATLQAPDRPRPQDWLYLTWTDVTPAE